MLSAKTGGEQKMSRDGQLVTRLKGIKAITNGLKPIGLIRLPD